MVASTLFGHKKGAFTGATKDRTGYFKQADGGILFLDEIADVPLDVQTSLLNFLQNKIIRPLGTDKDIQLDVQIIAATNKDLKAEIEKGNFRQDLYERLNHRVHLPPLRKRNGDIELLLNFYLQKLREKGHIDISVQDFDPKAWQKLLHYEWIGNIRQLKHAIESIDVERQVQETQIVNINCLPERIRNYQGGSVLNIENKSEGDNLKTNSPLFKSTQYFLQVLEQELQKNNGNK